MTLGSLPVTIVASIMRINGRIEEIARRNPSSDGPRDATAWLRFECIQDRPYLDNPALDRRYLVHDTRFDAETNTFHVIFSPHWLTLGQVRLSSVSVGEVVEHATIGTWCFVRAHDNGTRYLEVLESRRRIDWPRDNPTVRRVALGT